MKRLRSALLLVVCVTISTFAGTVKVTGDNVNLRVRPNTRYGTVGQVDDGTVLEAPDGLTKDWVRVKAPGSVSLFVFSRLVKNGKVDVAKLQVRGGPGVNYQVVGAVSRGDALVERGRVGDWLEIEAPSRCNLYIARDYVKAAPQKPAVVIKPKPTSAKNNPNAVAGDPPPQKKPGEKNTVQKPAVKPPVRVAKKPSRDRPPPKKQPVKPVKPPARRKPPAERVVAADEKSPITRTKLPEALIGKRLSGAYKQGVFSRVRGTVSKVSWLSFSSPAKYRLVTLDHKGRAVTVCYLAGQYKQLAKLKGQRIEAAGAKYWLAGKKYPVLATSQVVRRE